MGQPVAADGMAASQLAHWRPALRVSAMIRPASCGVVTLSATCRLASAPMERMPLRRARVRREVMDPPRVTSVLTSSLTTRTSKTPLRPR